MTATFFGREGRSKKPSELIASSPPGTSSGVGMPPTAITTFFAESKRTTPRAAPWLTCGVTRTECGPSNVASPTAISMPALVQLFS